MSRFREAMRRALTPLDSMSVERVQTVGTRGAAQFDNGPAVIVGSGSPRIGEQCSVVEGEGGQRYAMRTPARRRRPQAAPGKVTPEWAGQYGEEVTPVLDTQWLKSATAAAFEDSQGNPWLINVDRPGGGVNTRIIFYRGDAADRTAGWVAKAFINLYGYSGHPLYGDQVAFPSQGGPALIYDMSQDRGYIAYVHESYISEKFIVRRFDVNAGAGTLALQAANEYSFEADSENFMWPARTQALDGCLAPDGTPMFALLSVWFDHAAPFASGKVGIVFNTGTYVYAAGFVGPWGVIGPAKVRSRIVSEEQYGAWGAGSQDYPRCDLIEGGSLPYNWYTYRYTWAWAGNGTIYESPAGLRSNSFYPSSGPPAYRTVRHDADFKAYKEDCYIRVYRRNWGATVPPSRLVDFDYTNYYHIGDMFDGDSWFYDDGLAAGSLYIHPPVNRLRYGRSFITSLPMGPPGTTARRIYRTKLGGSTYYKVDDFAGNNPVIWTHPSGWEDTVSDGALGPEAPHTPDQLTMFEHSSRRVLVLRSGVAGDWSSAAWEYPGGRVKAGSNERVAVAQPTTDMTVAVVSHDGQQALDHFVKAAGSWGNRLQAAAFDDEVYIGSLLVFDGELFCSLVEYRTAFGDEWMKDFVVKGIPGAAGVTWEKGDSIYERIEGLTEIWNLAPVLCVCEEDVHLVAMLHDRHLYKLLWWNPDDGAWDGDVAEEIAAEWPAGETLNWHGAPAVVGGLDTWYIDVWEQQSPLLVKLRVTDWREA